MKISVSRINEIGFCPRSHYYTYTLQLEPKRASEALDLGKLVHASLEEYYKTGVMPTIPDNLGEIGEKARSATQTYSLMAKRQDNFEVIDVEKEFSTYLEDLDVEFVGIIDAVVRLEGELWLLEHKVTGGQHWSSERVQMANQHVLYELVAQELYGEQVAGTIYNFLRITQRGGKFHTDIRRTYMPADEHARLSAYEDLAEKLGVIRSGYKARNPGAHCTYCKNFRLCQSDYLGGDTQYLIETFHKTRDKNAETTEGQSG